MGRYLDIAKQVCPEVSKESMSHQMAALNQWIASQWESIPHEARELLLSQLNSVDAAIDLAYQSEDLSTFRAALSQKRALIEAHAPISKTLQSVLEVFPGAYILGTDDFDWGAHARRVDEFDKQFSCCYSCKGRRFWTWPGGVKRCATCHPPVGSGEVIWLEEGSV